MRISRRRFLNGTLKAGALGSLGGMAALGRLAPVSAAETTLPQGVQFTPEIEPLVRLIEDTPRSKCAEVMAHQLRKGMRYQEFLSALFLAGIRNVSPQPPGFKFHCVFIIHSCNYLSRMGPPDERYLPLFYALDDFKSAQEKDVEEGDFVLAAPRGDLPSGTAAWDELHASMAAWDEERADRAITALIRENDPETVFEGLWEYGARDYRNIGHKIIFVSHAWRTLETIGWQHAEPTLRSLMLGLLDFGRDEELNGYAFEDQGYRSNVGLVREYASKLPGDWAATGGNAAVVAELLAPLRSGQTEAACRLAARTLTEGRCKAGAVWDAIHLAAGELMMRQAGIAGVHTVTSANSMHYAFRASKNPETKLLMLLQGVAWMSQFRNFMRPERDVNIRITELEPIKLPRSDAAAMEGILHAVSGDRAEAASLAFSYAAREATPDRLFDAARGLVFTKCTEHHQYKWPAAIFEDYYQVSPEWRPHMAATSMYYLRGAGHPDSRVIERAIDELQRA